MLTVHRRLFHSNDNFSWNCGVEGHTDDQGVLGLRARQMKNLHLALMLSQGTPMVLAGTKKKGKCSNILP